MNFRVCLFLCLFLSSFSVFSAVNEYFYYSTSSQAQSACDSAKQSAFPDNDYTCSVFGGDTPNYQYNFNNVNYYYFGCDVHISNSNCINSCDFQSSTGECLNSCPSEQVPNDSGVCICEPPTVLAPDGSCFTPPTCDYPLILDNQTNQCIYDPNLSTCTKDEVLALSSWSTVQCVPSLDDYRFSSDRDDACSSFFSCTNDWDVPQYSDDRCSDGQVMVSKLTATGETIFYCKNGFSSCDGTRDFGGNCIPSGSGSDSSGSGDTGTTDTTTDSTTDTTTDSTTDTTTDSTTDTTGDSTTSTTSDGSTTINNNQTQNNTNTTNNQTQNNTTTNNTQNVTINNTTEATDFDNSIVEQNTQGILDKLSEEKTASVDCSVSVFECASDPINCALLKLQFDSFCYQPTEEDTKLVNNFDIDDSIESQLLEPSPMDSFLQDEALSEVVDVANFFDFRGLGWGNTCPASKTYPLGRLGSITLDYAPFCSLAEIFSFLVMFTATSISIRILGT